MSFAYSVTDLRRIEREALAGGLPLMERAGRAAADFLGRRLGRDRKILILAGPGNNGGDALVTARYLFQAGYLVEVVTPALAQRPYSGDAERAWLGWLAAGGQAAADFDQTGDYGAVVDGLFGIGLDRPLTGEYVRLVERIDQLNRPVLALDVPSGVLADSGAVPGAAIRANWTLAMLAPSRGLFTGAALDRVGELHCATLGVEPDQRGLHPLPVLAQAPETCRRLLRRQDSHKGSYGSVQILGGNDGMVGAALLAGRAAVAVGCGRVSLGLLARNPPSVDPLQPELMLHGPGLLPAGDIAVVGPGLGQDATARRVLAERIEAPQSLLLDADALNLLAKQPALRTALRQRQAPTLLTPHPTEAARLLDCATAEVQAQRFEAVQKLAETFAAIVVLKGAGSLIASRETCAINHSGGPALANAGQGDALAGLLAGLWAQGLAAFEAATIAVWLHGRCCDTLLARQPGRLAVSASAIIAESVEQLGLALEPPAS
ncbi:NAD(P)H-hydrate dehydratase [Chitinimonas lacunae]|uniref:Bifunctional NAD(P)H-hydrate repair enzyme n=1 Tax=Chitinimonas lacunae TaxID=1963018 RepID=A0ABV8MTA0_9NEIS